MRLYFCFQAQGFAITRPRTHLGVGHLRAQDRGGEDLVLGGGPCEVWPRTAVLTYKPAANVECMETWDARHAYMVLRHEIIMTPKHALKHSQPQRTAWLPQTLRRSRRQTRLWHWSRTRPLVRRSMCRLGSGALTTPSRRRSGRPAFASTARPSQCPSSRSSEGLPGMVAAETDT